MRLTEGKRKKNLTQRRRGHRESEEERFKAYGQNARVGTPDEESRLGAGATGSRNHENAENRKSKIEKPKPLA